MLTRTTSRTNWILLILCVLILPAFFLAKDPRPLEILEAVSGEGKLDPAVIAQRSGFHGSYDPQKSVYRISFPRKNLHVSVEGIPLTPGMGLTAWASFSGSEGKATLIADIPLLETEVTPVLRSAVASGLDVTALHNMFVMDSPRIMSLHLEARGMEDVLAGAIGSLFAQIAKSQPKQSVSTRRLDTLPSSRRAVDSRLLESVFGKGKVSDGTFHVSLGLGTHLKGQELGEAAGMNSWADFTGEGDHAFVTGDIACLEDEVQLALTYLMDAGVQITSIHTHLIQEVPRVVFIHFYGTGKLDQLAQGVKFAFDSKEEFQSQ